MKKITTLLHMILKNMAKLARLQKSGHPSAGQAGLFIWPWILQQIALSLMAKNYIKRSNFSNTYSNYSICLLGYSFLFGFWFVAFSMCAISDFMPAGHPRTHFMMKSWPKIISIFATRTSISKLFPILIQIT